MDLKETEGTKTNQTSFELCDVCNLNHNNGRRHRYQASHRRSLAALFSRFQSKLADLRFFLRHPTLLRPEHAALNGIWCVFCSLDLLELDSPFACNNAINHLASPDHLKNLKDFFRKHGGSMDRIDSFRVSEADFVKWEKGCSALKSADSCMGEGPIGPHPGPSKDIQNEITTNHADSFQKNYIRSFSSCVTNDVMPLQSLTYENDRLCGTEVHGAESIGSSPYDSTSLSVAMQENLGVQIMHPFGNAAENLTGGQHKDIGSNGKSLITTPLRRRVDQRTASEESCTTGFKLCTGSVHTGALPPWLDLNQETEKNLLINEPSMWNHTFPLSKKRKSHKLNPKRVGAAWSDKRRIELEMEKRGEPVTNSSDANWLPNFGRVWQAGTRKESRKEFEKEKQKLFKEQSPSEISFKMQPYISKRMRTSSSNNDGAAHGPVEEFNSSS